MSRISPENVSRLNDHAGETATQTVAAEQAEDDGQPTGDEANEDGEKKEKGPSHVVRIFEHKCTAPSFIPP